MLNRQLTISALWSASRELHQLETAVCKVLELRQVEHDRVVILQVDGNGVDFLIKVRPDANDYNSAHFDWSVFDVYPTDLW